MPNMEAEIQTHIPNIDHVISNYSVVSFIIDQVNTCSPVPDSDGAQGYLEHASQLYVSEEDPATQSPLAEALETVTALLVSASGDFSDQNETFIRGLVEKFISSLNATNGVDSERRQMPFAAKKLDQTIQVSSQRNISSTLGLASGAVDLEA